MFKINHSLIADANPEPNYSWQVQRNNETEPSDPVTWIGEYYGETKKSKQNRPDFYRKPEGSFSSAYQHTLGFFSVRYLTR